MDNNNNNQQQNNDWNNWNNWDNNNNNQQQNNDWNNWNNWDNNNNNNQQQNNDWNNWNNWDNNNNNQQQNNDWNNWNNWDNNNNNQQQNNDWNNWSNNVTTWGDANNDKTVDMGDTVSVMQSLANPNNHQLTQQGAWNADVYQPGGGVTNSDAASIQSFLLGYIPNLPDQNNWNNQWNNQPQQNNDWNNWNNQPQQNNTSTPVSGGQKYSVGNGMNQHKGDNVDGYSYEIWLDNTGGSGSMTLGSGGSFSTEWSAQVSSGNFLARRGRNYDASKKATQYGSIVMDYAADYSASSQGNSRLCVYGWMKDPLVEYYIIEDWVNWCPKPNGGSKTVTIDGAEYEIFQLDHTGPTILGDTRTFKQYFSVRKSKRTSGTITVSDHFKAWEAAGWNIGNLTEVALNVEGWESSGKANVTKLTISEGSGSSNSQPQQNNWNNWDNNNNNQQQNNDWNNWNNWNQPQQNNDWNSWNNWNNNAQPANNNQGNSGKKLVAISFDDGASATSRQDPAYRIMDALIKNNMTATFFYVSDWIKTNEQVQFAYQNGMEVANHTKSHQSLGSLGSSQIRSEWEQCNSKLRSIIGAEPSHLMRLPYLDGGGQVKSALYDVPLISCGLDTQDWNGASKEQIVNTIKQAAQNGSLEGKIVLCHENYASTAAAMEEVLPWLAQNGYANVTISEMFAAKGKTLQGGQIYTQA